MWVCYYHMTISLFPVKAEISSLLIHKANPRHDTLDLIQLEKSKYCFICQRFENRGVLEN